LLKSTQGIARRRFAMARSSALPHRKQVRDAESLLIRSAESLGRMIGTLQRQLEDVRGQLSASNAAGAATSSRPELASPAKPLPRRRKAADPAPAAGDSPTRLAARKSRSSSTRTAAARKTGKVGSPAAARARKTAKKKTARAR
jgi:hypothetical protein